jgi:hypothetical protein
MTMNNETNANADLNNVGALLKDLARDCRFGFCRHAECQRKAELRFADTSSDIETDETADEGDFDPGFDVGATLKDVLREQRIERILGIGRGFNRGPRRVRRSRPVVDTSVRLTEDGRIDKDAMRQEKLFGRPALYV